MMAKPPKGVSRYTEIDWLERERFGYSLADRSVWVCGQGLRQNFDVDEDELLIKLCFASRERDLPFAQQFFSGDDRKHPIHARESRFWLHLQRHGFSDDQLIQWWVEVIR